MRTKLLITFLVILMSAACTKVEYQKDLSGTWKFIIDSLDQGKDQQYYLTEFPDDTLHLPGSLDSNGKGFAVGVNTEWTGQIVDQSWYTADKYEKYRKPGNIKIPCWLQPDFYYVGAAWYQREIRIPPAWKGQRIILTLERCHWTTSVWIDDSPLGDQVSLATPHRYDLSKFAKPGRHLLTIRVDNRMFVDVGLNAHSVSDHTQGNWNGIVGGITLEALPLVALGPVKVYPDIKNRVVKVVGGFENPSAQPEEIAFEARVFKNGTAQTVMSPVKFIKVIPTGSEAFEFIYAMGDSCQLWDEFSPNLYRLDLTATMKSTGKAEHQDILFGMREFRADSTRLAINGRPTFLRGTLECAIFPKTGYPALKVEEWQRIYRVIKSHGLNHMRFHSWCPPEAAFTAADIEGVYLYAECGAWAKVGTGNDFDKWLYAESERIVNEYGNHPSFVMMSYGNEPGGSNQVAFLEEFVSYWKSKDNRRVYTAASGWPTIPSQDFYCRPEPRIQGWGQGLGSIINAQPPQTRFDFREINATLFPGKPVVSHEIGQWCVYPNFNEIPKYTGNLKAKNFEIFKETLEASNLGNLSSEFLLASGKLQALCYKADIEAALRTPGMAGFQLLDLHDFPGQGTALVGVLDPFWEEKGYISPAEYSAFCNAVTPLARIDRMVLSNNETFKADIEIANYGAGDLKEEVVIRIKSSEGPIVSEKVFPKQSIPTGTNTSIGPFEWPLASIKVASKFTMEVSVGDKMNSWDLWVYPLSDEPVTSNQQPVTSKPATSNQQPVTSVPVFPTLTPALVKLLENGGSAILALGPDGVAADKGGSIALGFSSIFWNTAWTGRQAPHTLGILCDPKHPALADFPTEYHSNWQWWDIVSQAKPLIINQPDTITQPIVRIIDDWVTNRSLALVAEYQVGNGKLILTGADLTTKLNERIGARQLLRSLQRYAATSNFKPSQDLNLNEVRSYLK
jgi:hypothetical protein